jgi:hypothetical protein
VLAALLAFIIAQLFTSIALWRAAPLRAALADVAAGGVKGVLMLSQPLFALGQGLLCICAICEEAVHARAFEAWSDSRATRMHTDMARQAHCDLV